MGRYLKNTELQGGSYSVRLPIGSNTLSPTAPQVGQIKFNSSTNRIEFYYNNQWYKVAKVGIADIVVDTFVSNGINTQDFTMSQSELYPEDIIVHIGGVFQEPTTHYTVSGTNIHFTSVPPAPGINPNKIVVLHNFNSTDATY